ncbi:MAG TPA: cyclic peptide export ABC transporter [Pyrinomonadaceae bacterium]|jgi:putative ATP-binding cassette transporter
MKLFSFIFLLRKSRNLLLLALLFSLLSGAASSLLIITVNTGLHEQRPARLLYLFIALCLALPVTRLISQTLLSHLSEKAVFEMRMHLCRGILSTPLRKLEEVGAHRLLATLSGDIGAITNAFINLPIFLINLAVVVGCMAYIAYLSWTVFFVILVMMIIAVTTIQLPQVWGRRFLTLARNEGDTLYNHFRALTEGSKELKLHRERRLSFIDRVLRATAQSVRQYNVRGVVIFAASGSWAQFLFFCILGFIVFGLPNVTATTGASITGYALTILYMAVPMEILMGIVPVITQANVAASKIESLGLSLAAESDLGEEAAATRADNNWEGLELRGVTHSYLREGENSTFTLGPLDVVIRRGELLFLTGGNGSGKTTLAKLLTGLYAPEGGQIVFDGIPVTDENRDWYRQHFSALFTDFFLFESFLGLEMPELDSRAREYLTQLQLDHKVKINEGALSTIDLSQGQRKRLALLTAYLEDRPIYVFDEWAADQDPLFRDIFYFNILPELKARGKTLIVISHDDRYYHLADRLIKLDYGRIEFDRTASLAPETTGAMPRVATR